jgi:tetratricopeptide (TPR) repeat protein
MCDDLGRHIVFQFDKAGERMDEGAGLWRELDNKPMLSNTLSVSVYQLYWQGKDEKVLSVADEIYQISSSINEEWNQAAARNFQGLVWFDYGEIDQALAALEESIRLAAHLNPIYPLWYRAMLCRMYAELGAVDLGTQIYHEYRLPDKDIPYAPPHTSTLVSFALFEISSGQLDTAAATLADCEPDAPPWESVLRLAKCKLALARGNFCEAIALANSTIELTSDLKLGQYLPEALFLKGKILFIQGDLHEAKVTLEQALTEAKYIGSRYLQWQALAILASLEPDQESSRALKDAAREIVDYIADHISPVDLKESFARFASEAGV